MGFGNYSVATFGVLYLALVVGLLIFVVNSIVRHVRAVERQANLQARCAEALETIASTLSKRP